MNRSALLRFAVTGFIALPAPLPAEEPDRRPVLDSSAIVEALDRLVLVPKSASPKAARLKAREVRRLDVPAIEFQPDSTELAHDRAREQVRQLAEALRHPRLADAVVTLAGHASADGSEEHNLGLSLRRAARLRDLLVQQHQIEPARLRIEGKGETELLPGLPPESERNRRVEVIREPDPSS